MRAALIAAAAVVALVVSACGKSDSTGLSHAQLVKEADAACKRLDKRIAKVEEPENASGYIKFIDGTHAAVKQIRDELRALKPSAGNADTYNELASTYVELERTLTKLTKAAKQEAPLKIERLSSDVDRLVTSSHKTAKELGASECAS
jgi:hypothetical protein